VKRLSAFALGAAIVGTTLVGTTLTVAVPAWAADIPTSIAFTSDASDLSVPFGSAWDMPIRVTSKSDRGTYDVTTNDGTVDIFVEGMPGEYVTAATIYPGGMVYFAPPANEPALGAGEYSVTAVFTPAAGSEFSTSKTKKPAVLTITSIGVTTSAKLLTDPSVVTMPTVRTRLSGEFVDDKGVPPSGTWTVTGTDSDGTEAFSISADQPTESDEGAVGPLDIPITGELEPGETYEVRTVFTPDPLIARGIDFENPAPATFSTPSLTPAEVLSGPVTISMWIVVLNGILFIGLVVLLVLVLGVWSRGRVAKEDAASLAPAIAGAPGVAAIGSVSPVASIESAETVQDEDEDEDDTENDTLERE